MKQFGVNMLVLIPRRGSRLILVYPAPLADGARLADALDVECAVSGAVVTGVFGVNPGVHDGEDLPVYIRCGVLQRDRARGAKQFSLLHCRGSLSIGRRRTGQR